MFSVLFMLVLYMQTRFIPRCLNHNNLYYTFWNCGITRLRRININIVNISKFQNGWLYMDGDMLSEQCRDGLEPSFTYMHRHVRMWDIICLNQVMNHITLQEDSNWWIAIAILYHGVIDIWCQTFVWIGGYNIF